MKFNKNKIVLSLSSNLKINFFTNNKKMLPYLNFSFWNYNFYRFSTFKKNKNTNNHNKNNNKNNNKTNKNFKLKMMLN